MTELDTIVVGAGPAGAHLAIRLARAGRSVVVLDRCRFPRTKTCGEFLGPECIPLLAEVGLLDDVLSSGARPVRRLEVRGFGHTVVGRFVDVGRHQLPAATGYAISRAVLDHSAVLAARSSGAEVREGWSVGGLLRDGTGRVLGVRATAPDGTQHELRARITVGADGSNGRVARELGVRRDVPWLRRIALSTRIRGVALDGHAEVHLLERAYFAIAPIEGGDARLNLVVDLDVVRGGRAVLPSVIEAHLERVPALRATIGPSASYGPIETCGPLASSTTRQAFDGAVLVGDACGYVDPITGEGLYFAMRGAALLARELERLLALRRFDASDLSDYTRARRDEFRHRRGLALALQRGLRRPIVRKSVLRLIEARPGLADVLVATTGASLPPRELLRPGTWTRALAERRSNG